ncbi:MAG: MMPL family transporter [Desulfobacteraceae bacterium]|nr:MMPL family transporter [Desulfobacteraceae bacterium]
MGIIRDRIESWFEFFSDFLFENKFKVILFYIVIFAVLFSQIPKIKIDTSTEAFLHEKDPALIAYNEFRDRFGRDELIILSIETENVFDLEFLKDLKSFHEKIESEVPHLDDVTSLYNARRTTGKKDELIVEDFLENFPKNQKQLNELEKEAIENPLYVNMIFSQDKKHANIVIKTDTYSAEGVSEDIFAGFEDTGITSKEKRKYLTPKENLEIINSVKKLSKEFENKGYKVRIAGSPVVTETLKVWMMKDLRKFVLMSLAVIIILLYLMFKRFSFVIISLVVVISSVLTTISLMAITNTPYKIPTNVLPSFLLAVCVGAAVHILAIFLRQMNLGKNKKEALSYSMGHSGLAIFMTSLTTAAGLSSFAAADIAPIADLGLFASIGVMLGFLYSVTIIPALIAVFPVKVKKKKNTENADRLDLFLSSIGDFAVKRKYFVLSFFILVIAVSGAGLLKLKFSHNFLEWLPDNAALRHDTKFIDENLKGSITMEVIVDTGKKNGLYDPDIMKRISKFKSEMEKIDKDTLFVGKVLALSDVLKEINKALNENRDDYYKIPDNRDLIAQEFILFENSGSDDLEDFTDSNFQKARITLKLPWIDAIEYSDFIDETADIVKNYFPECKTDITGMIALTSRTFAATISTMAKSYIIAVIVITIIMLVLIGNIKLGLLSMVPNLTPIIIGMAFIGWFNFPLDLFTMLVGSIAIGLAVDDTIHFMHNFRRYYDKTGSVSKAVHNTLMSTGRAMLTTTLVLSAGFLIYTIAEMNNLYNFGVITAISIFFALLSDFLLAPALLAITLKDKKMEA